MQLTVNLMVTLGGSKLVENAWASRRGSSRKSYRSLLVPWCVCHAQRQRAHGIRSLPESEAYGRYSKEKDAISSPVLLASHSRVKLHGA